MDTKKKETDPEGLSKSAGKYNNDFRWNTANGWFKRHS